LSENHRHVPDRRRHGSRGRRQPQSDPRPMTPRRACSAVRTVAYAIDTASVAGAAVVLADASVPRAPRYGRSRSITTVLEWVTPPPRTWGVPSLGRRRPVQVQPDDCRGVQGRVQSRRVARRASGSAADVDADARRWTVDPPRRGGGPRRPSRVSSHAHRHGPHDSGDVR
jgi:hypothetical protein